MSGRFPGAPNTDQFWKNLCNGVESITELTDEQLLGAGEDPEVLASPFYVKAASILDGIELFDADFFGLPPREAMVMDPQHRIFLECAWEALENAGYDPELYDGKIGVFAGSGMHSYYEQVLAADPGALRTFAGLQRYIALEKDFLTTRVSYRLNLKGPSVAIQTACSTSLVAVHFACQSLLNGDSDMVLAGGVSFRIPQIAGYLHEEGSILSPDGHCRAFDAMAGGTVFSSGIGIVVLKRLADALADGDSIRAVIKGSAINNDGAMKVGYTAPSADGQASCIAEAMAVAGVQADEVSYVETHGTGTSMGDPIEIAGLTKAFRATTAKKNFCAIGSLKTNLGHLDAAAGVAGLIKVALALENRALPPSLHFTQPNPAIDFAGSPFYVQTALSDWKPEKPRRVAGVSSFGIGGTNAHVVLEEAPPIPASSVATGRQLLTLSAKSPASLEEATGRICDWLATHPDLNLADAAFTLQQGRRAFPYRRVVAAENAQEAIAVLKAGASMRAPTGKAFEEHASVVFMFPAQGAQHANMGRDLYEREPVFREWMDRCAIYLLPQLGYDLRQLLYPDEAHFAEASEQLKQTRLTQPAVFTLNYALAQLWKSWGITPDAMVGHSLGEYVAATLAGVFDLEDALSLIAERGRLMQELPSGSMLAVYLSEEKVQPWLRPDVSLAAVNAPELTVLSGPTEAIEKLANALRAEQINVQPLLTSHAFHSAMMEPMLATFVERVARTHRRAPTVPFVSTLTGTWITDEQAVDPEYWGKQTRHGVRFSPAILELTKTPGRVLLEVGPNNSLSTLARLQFQPEQQCRIVNSLRHPKEDRSDQECMLTALGSLWSAGVPVEWSRLHGNQERRRIPLPTYAFERKRFWIDPPAAGAGISQMRRTGASESFSVAAQSGEQDKSPALASSTRATEGGQLASRGEIEKRLSMLWQEVLGVPQIGIHDNFFELGGQSLMGVTLVNEITQLFGRRFPLQTLLNAPTVHQFSEVILKEQESGGQSGRVDGGRNSIADQVRSFILENYPPSGELRNSDSFSEFGIINEESILHLISFLEETYGFTVPDSDFNSGNIDSIDSISRYVLYRRNGGREKTVAGAESNR